MADLQPGYICMPKQQLIYDNEIIVAAKNMNECNIDNYRLFNSICSHCYKTNIDTISLLCTMNLSIWIYLTSKFIYISSINIDFKTNDR